MAIRLIFVVAATVVVDGLRTRANRRLDEKDVSRAANSLVSQIKSETNAVDGAFVVGVSDANSFVGPSTWFSSTSGEDDEGTTPPSSRATTKLAVESTPKEDTIQESNLELEQIASIIDEIPEIAEGVSHESFENISNSLKGDPLLDEIERDIRAVSGFNASQMEGIGKAAQSLTLIEDFSKLIQNRTSSHVLLPTTMKKISKSLVPLIACALFGHAARVGVTPKMVALFTAEFAKNLVMIALTGSSKRSTKGAVKSAIKGGFLALVSVGEGVPSRFGRVLRFVLNHNLDRIVDKAFESEAVRQLIGRSDDFLAGKLEGGFGTKKVKQMATTIEKFQRWYDKLRGSIGVFLTQGPRSRL